MLVSFEGPEGSGKTTQLQLLAQHLLREGMPFVITREPGGTSIGDQIRQVLHDPLNSEMDSRTEVLLYSASRAQLVAQVIRPALAAGRLVLCDRFYDSTLAYQGYGRGLDLAVLRALTALATGGLAPDLTIYLDIEPEEGLTRRQLGGEEWNRLDQEALAFHQRVRAGYLELIDLEPQRWVVIDAARPVPEVQQDIQAVLRSKLST